MKYLSQSMIGMIERCPAQFERRYINGEIHPPGVAARRGSATHKAISTNHGRKLITGQDLPVGDLQDAARDEYMRLIKTEGVFIPKADVGSKYAILNQGLNAAIRLTGLYHAKVAPAIMPAMVEERLEMDVGLPVPVAGTIDTATIDDWLPDFKTTECKKAESEAAVSIQLTIYSALFAQRVGRWPKKVSLEILVDKKDPETQSLVSARGPEDWEALIPRIEAIWRQIMAGIFPPCDPQSWVCSPTWCGYFASCKYASRRR
jgi:PD-(D/E)XK nuclease superfamily protein